MIWNFIIHQKIFKKVMTSAYFQRKIARLYGKTDQNGKTCNFVNFYPGNVVKCLNESLNLILSKSIYIINEILIFDDVISWNWQVVFQKNRKWRHLTSWRRIFFKNSGNVPFTDIMILWKFQVISIAQTEIMIDFRFLGIQRKRTKIPHLSFWTPQEFPKDKSYGAKIFTSCVK